MLFMICDTSLAQFVRRLCFEAINVKLLLFLVLYDVDFFFPIVKLALLGTFMSLFKVCIFHFPLDFVGILYNLTRLTILLY